MYDRYLLCKGIHLALAQKLVHVACVVTVFSVCVLLLILVPHKDHVKGHNSMLAIRAVLL